MLRYFVALCAVIILAAFAGTVATGQTIPPPVHLPIVRSDNTSIATTMQLINVVIRGNDIPLGWGIDADSYWRLDSYQPDTLSEYRTSYDPLNSALLWFQSEGIAYDSPANAQRGVQRLCDYYLYDVPGGTGSNVDWPPLGDKSCILYFAPQVRGERSNGVAFIIASFDKVRLLVWINYEYGEPDFFFAQNCIQLMAGRAGFDYLGSCNLHIYDSDIAADSTNSVASATNLYDCQDFNRQTSAQACFDFCVAQDAGDVHVPDGDDKVDPIVKLVKGSKIESRSSFCFR